MTLPVIEVCVESLDGLVVAQEAGADRIELCAGLGEGGLTPSLGMVRAALRIATVPVHVLVRPRSGDFLYSDLEFESMREDVSVFSENGVAAVVIGCLTENATVDESRTSALVRAAGDASVTFHRAFDMTRDSDEALEVLVRSGARRILTSGRHRTALEGAEMLQHAIERAAGRVEMIGCGGIRSRNVVELLDKTGLREIHFAPVCHTESRMLYRNLLPAMGADRAGREYDLARTAPEEIRAVIEAIRRA